MLQWLRDYETGGRRQPTPIRRRFLKQQYTTLVTVLGHFQAVYSAEFDHTGELSLRSQPLYARNILCLVRGKETAKLSYLLCARARVCVCVQVAGW